MTLWDEDTERRADMAHWLGHGRWAGPWGDAAWRLMGLRHVSMLCELAADVPWDSVASWPPNTVLDYGCGGGSNLSALSAVGPALVVAVDVDEETLTQAARMYSGSLRCVLAEEYQSSEFGGTVSAAICTAALQHTEPPEARRILRTIRASLAPGGIALIGTRRPVNGIGPGDVCALTTWDLAEARAEMGAAGFEVRRHWYDHANGYDFWGVRAR